MTEQPLSITGTYTASDVMSATWLSLRPSRSWRVAGVVLIPVLLWATWMEFYGPRAEAGGWMRWIIPGAALYIAFVLGILLPRKSRRVYEQRKDLQRPCSFSASDAGLLSSAEGVTGLKPWSDYLKWKESDSTLLLYMSDHMYQIIPKRFFASAADLDAFRSVVGQKIANRVE